jgi:hypothetical protein
MNPMKLISPQGVALIAAVTAVLAGSAALHAASLSQLATGLQTPTKIAFSTKGNLLVAESGTSGNTGRISLIDPVTGARRTLLDGMPSGRSIPANEPSGPSGLVMRGRTLYVAIGLGEPPEDLRLYHLPFVEIEAVTRKDKQ